MRIGPTFDRRLSAFTLIEMLVGASIAAVALGLLMDYFRSGTMSTAACLEYNDAMRSVFLGFEMIRSDLSRIVYVNEGNLYNVAFIGSDGPAQRVGGKTWAKAGAFTFKVAAHPGSDPWATPYELVSYGLTYAPGSRTVLQLKRTDSKGSTILPGCYFTKATLAQNSGFPGNPNLPYAEITLIGVGNLNPKYFYKSAMFVPLNPIFEPTPYLVRGL